MTTPDRERFNQAIPSFSDSASSAQAEASLPNSLKNTPSNIARLEDVIEQRKGRHKYLAKTKSPSDGIEVRWYFSKVPLGEKELSASVPRTEIVGKSEYFRFSMRDSLALEASFLQREEELLAYWWKEYAQCSEGPSGSCAARNMTAAQQLDESYVVEEDRVGVPIKGGIYEVDLTRRHCFPVYWNGGNRRVLRGHWFARKAGLDWIPLREDVAEQLELAYHCKVWHRRTFQPSGLFAAHIDLQGISQNKLLQGLHALFTGEDDTWEAWLVFDTSGFKIGGGKGIKLRRGFSLSGSRKPTQDELRQQKEEEMDDYCYQVPVGHLVFMVHGIGQRLENANLVDDVGDFRHITAILAERHLTAYQRSTQRVLFIPCQWRKGLKLSSESAVERITLDGVRGLRLTLSATVHDVLYYMSPIYCQHIIDSVSNQLNRLYLMFLKRNPGYDGKVSLYGHSLGSVLCYDILCHQDCLSSPFPTESVNMETIPERMPKQECQVKASYLSISSSCDVSLERNYTSRHGEDLEQLAHAMTECSPFAISDAMSDKNTMQDLSSASRHFFTLNNSNSLCSEGKSYDFVTPRKDEKQPLHDKKVDQLSCASFNEDEKSSTADYKHGSGSSYSVAERLGDTMCGNLIDEDKLISLLEKEVKSLKARIAELEQKHQYTNLGSEKDYSHDFYQGKDAKNTMKQSRDKLFSEQDDRIKSCTPCIRYIKLDFKVDTFFAVGSPLGVFLALRNARIGIGRGKDYWHDDEEVSEEMPSCQKMFNIFHPFDPVAFRIEPLVCKEYVSKHPVIIPYHRGGKRLHIGFQEFAEDIAIHSQAIANHLKSFKNKAASILQSRKKDKMEGAQKKERSYGSIMMERLTGSEDGRIDHVLQVIEFNSAPHSDKTFELPYISAIGSHNNYWRDHDTALFILKHLYRNVPEEPLAEGFDDQYSSATQRKPISIFYERDAMGEDTPLMF
ncbi:phospholipase SGR2-like isoform X1 [Typha latifolia]|uniref:phospholipase SGR2-like isoform X1 n=3 Tax=Typha latifolia TaxID=4733 RepID=UPI003C2AF62F